MAKAGVPEIPSLSATRAYAITPNDTQPSPPQVYRAFILGGAGNVKVLMSNQDTAEAVTFVGLVAGMVYPFAIQQVFLTGTTATNIVGLV
jgi:hypothetical protein